MDESFIQRVQNLPFELYEEIYGLTFAIDSTSCHIDSKYKPPSILQVDRTTRAGLEGTYYQNTIFTFNFPVDPHCTSETYTTEHALCARWLSSMPEKRLLKLRQIRLLTGLSIPADECYTEPWREDVAKANKMLSMVYLDTAARVKAKFKSRPAKIFPPVLLPLNAFRDIVVLQISDRGRGGGYLFDCRRQCERFGSQLLHAMVLGSCHGYELVWR